MRTKKTELVLQIATLTEENERLRADSRRLVEVEAELIALRGKLRVLQANSGVEDIAAQSPAFGILSAFSAEPQVDPEAAGLWRLMPHFIFLFFALSPLFTQKNLCLLNHRGPAHRARAVPQDHG